jgi:oligopeptide transport system substrate-binding protein
MKSAVWLLLLLTLIAMIVACAAPAAPATPQTIIVKETVVTGGTPQVVERVVTATPAATAVPAKPKRPNIVRVNASLGDVPSIDPGVAEDTTSITVVEETFMGLTRLDEVTNELHPGMATKWDISPDGKTYTFAFRKDVSWVRWDGSKKQVVKVQTCPDKDGKTKDRLVTAKDFEYGIVRALKPETASPYAYVLAFVIEGAADYNAGTLKDASKVGVKALDDWTLQVKFIEPAAYNANIIGLWTAMAVPKWVIEGDECTTRRGERWTEPGFFQSFGPFTLKEWIHDSTLTIIKNPFWIGDQWTPQPKVDEVTFSMLDPVPAMAEFETSNLDWVEVPLADMDRVRGDAKLSKLLTISPSFCTYYYGFNTKAKFVDDVRVRRALSMAVDRVGLIKNVTKGEQEPAQWFARPGLVGAPTMKDYPDLGVKYHPTEAKKLLDEYLKEKGLTLDKLDITAMYSTSSSHQKIAEYIQQQWKTNLGLSVKLTNQEWKVFLKTTKSEDTPQIFRMGWCLDYPDANNFDREVLSVGGSQNPARNGVPYGGVNWNNIKYEELVRKAAQEMDPKKRVDLYAQAEKILNWDDAAIIPLYWYTSVQVTQPWIKRTISIGGHQRYEHWEIVQQ